MKLRLRGQRLRARIDHDEVAALARGESVRSHTVLGHARIWTVTLSPGDALAISEDPQGMVILLPRADLVRWPHDDREGFAFDAPVTDTHTLHVLVERDLPCDHRDQPAPERQNRSRTDER